MVIEEWSNATGEVVKSFWSGVQIYAWRALGALIVFVVGWLIAFWIGKIIASILKAVKFDTIFEKTKWQEALDGAEIKLSASAFLGKVVAWVLAIVVLLASVEILVPGAFFDIKGQIIAWLPNLLIAIAIFVVAVIVSDLAEKIAKAIIGKMDVHYVNLTGLIIKWAIWILAAFAILSQLGVAENVVNILMTGIVALIVLGGALAFGLGGKDLAKEILEGLRKKIKE
jgi:hypothetical protein